ncbi:hypothetical protein Bbelb_338840 [Branchiostoma belcheri]|nr:hypothetical protein Bbelb_338840 [Branchiostoma belcheri]
MADNTYVTLEVDKPIQVDPRGSWMSFVKHSNNGNKNNGRKKRKEQEKTLGLLSDPPTTNPGARKGAARKHGPPGPQGPPGPRGPAGPPGAVITKDEMFREFKEMVREAAERRALRLLQEKHAAPLVLASGHTGKRLTLSSQEHDTSGTTCRGTKPGPKTKAGNLTGPTTHNYVSHYEPPAPGADGNVKPGEAIQHLGIWPYWDDTNSPPKLHDAFHCRLRGNVVIPRKTLMELKNFQTPFGGGTFVRGTGMNLREGRFTAHRPGVYHFSLLTPVSCVFPQPFGGGAFVRGTGMNLREGRFTAHRPGVYHFSATLHIGHPRQKRLRPRDSVRALICINSLCQRHTSLEVVTGIESNSRVFTISVSGMLELQSGQYTSIFMDNSSKKPVTVQSGSDFTANFVGQICWEIKEGLLSRKSCQAEEDESRSNKHLLTQFPAKLPEFEKKGGKKYIRDTPNKYPDVAGPGCGRTRMSLPQVDPGIASFPL